MRSRTLLLLSVLVTVVVVAGAALLQDPTPGQVGGSDRPATSSVSRAATVLRAWDRRRARAWADDDRSAVRALYVPGSRAGRRDLAMLAAYHQRGLRVTTMKRQVLAMDVVTRTADTWALEVTDRLAEARVGRNGSSRVLPRSRPATRRIELRRVADTWKVVEVYDD
jgi:hypothetical protein